MSIPAAALIKGGLGLGVLGAGATGVYFLSNKAPVAETVLDKSKYDQALLSFLNKADGNNDIVFEVKKVTTSGNSETEANLDTSSFGTFPVKIRAKVTVTKSGTNFTSSQLKTNVDTLSTTDLGDIATLNNGSWTWTCDVEFTKEESESNTAFKTEYKERVFKDTDKGLFGILKKELRSYSGDSATGTEWTKEDLKKVKSDFIGRCAQARTFAVNKTINDASTITNQLKTTKTFQLQNEGASDLVPKDTEDFNIWFEDKYRTNTYKSQ